MDDYARNQAIALGLNIGLRKRWSTRSAERWLLHAMWTPSPPREDAYWHSIHEFIFNNKKHEAFLLARKSWVHKHGGFRKRTNPEEYQ